MNRSQRSDLSESSRTSNDRTEPAMDEANKKSRAAKRSGFLAAMKIRIVERTEIKTTEVYQITDIVSSL